MRLPRAIDVSFASFGVKRPSQLAPGGLLILLPPTLAWALVFV